jgi:hypothetical protein
MRQDYLPFAALVVLGACSVVPSEPISTAAIADGPRECAGIAIVRGTDTFPVNLNQCFVPSHYVAVGPSER